MKFKKLLSLCIAIAAMGITACNGAASSKQPSTTSQAASTSSKHTHKWGEGVVTKEATCSEKGVKTYTCSECNEKKTEDIPVKAHTYNDGVVTKEATCAVPGVKTYTCTACGATKTEEIFVAHTWTDGTPVQNAEGKNVIPMTCVCGKVGAKISVNDFASAEFDSESDNQPNSVRPKQKVNIVWNIVAPKAGKYTVTMDMFCAKNGDQKMSSRSFKISVGETEYPKYDYGDLTADDLGMTATNAVNVTLAENVDLVEGANAISLYCAGYRLIYTNYLVITED